MPTPTLEDVARHAGVSTATVSRAINTPDRVQEQTRLRVEAAIKTLSYTPNFGGQALASRRTNTVGAVIPTMDNAIFGQALQVLEESLAREGVTLLVATSQYNREREEAQVRALVGRGVDGLILIGAERPPAIYDMLDQRELPYVILWVSSGEGRHVTIGFDNDAAARMVVQRVYDAGHRKIAMIVGVNAGNDRAMKRAEGARKMCAELGLPALRIVESSYTLEAGEYAAQQILSNGERPTAIICGNDVLAAGAIFAARKLGLDVPRDLSIVGFDDIDLARVTLPPLTTVRVPHRRMGRTAARHILDWIRSDQRPDSVVYDAEWVERQSLAPPAM
ncbi:LacI family transcriptional regulator [Monaibacterium marinum]|uniref:LacI family transcriptional regulator n=1 Tax=Pontivivens marinum TaxID=1690039 RepID=A0A2C9CTP8_9RHOB|nr:LacI family DNA-binding transcriptional regulator [Monaibacterium marinum]SOH93759.1 LacI family transcriptional regulator [Monaibacterium marinum]